MKTFLQLLGLLVVGFIAITLVGMAIGIVGWLLQVLIPLAIVAVIGLVVWKLLLSPAPAQPDPSSPGREDEGRPKQLDPPKPTGLSDAEALRQFEEMKRNRPD